MSLPADQTPAFSVPRGVGVSAKSAPRPRISDVISTNSVNVSCLQFRDSLSVLTLRNIIRAILQEEKPTVAAESSASFAIESTGTQAQKANQMGGE